MRGHSGDLLWDHNFYSTLLKYARAYTTRTGLTLLIFKLGLRTLVGSGSGQGTHHSLVAVREQHDYATLSDPLGLATGDELINDALRRVGEVAELGLPQHHRVGV